MKKILALSLFITLLSSFLSGDYTSNSSSSPLSLYDGAFPLIKEEGGKYTVDYPAAYIPGSATEASNRKGFKVWYENGMGNYSIDVKHGELIGQSSLITKYDPLMMASILYENPRRPPGTSARVTINEGAAAENQSNMLLSGRQIKLFANVPRIVSDDPMTFAISYKFDHDAESGTAYRIVLKYNHAGSSLKNVFTPVNEKDSVDIPVATINTNVADHYELSSNNIPSVRNFSTELKAYHVTGNEFLEEETLSASRQPDNELKEPDPLWTDLRFNNAIVFSALVTDKKVHNLFITLKPTTFNHDEVLKGQKVFVEAVVQKISSGKSSKRITAPEDIETSRVQDKAADAHDPNDVTVSPECIQLPQKSTRLHYRVNFENTGGGDADNVLIAFTPPGYCTINTVKVTKVVCGSQIATSFPDPLFQAHSTDAGGRIIFPIKGTLKGAYVNTKPEADAQTKGSIEFDLEVSPNGDVKQAIEMKAWAGIFFHSVNGGNTENNINADSVAAKSYPAATIGYESPVVTDPARTFYKEHCGKTPTTCLSIWWWLLIGLIILIFVLWWLLRRRRRNANAS